MLLQYISIVTQNMGVGTMGAVGVLMGAVGVTNGAVGVPKGVSAWWDNTLCMQLLRPVLWIRNTLFGQSRSDRRNDSGSHYRQNSFLPSAFKIFFNIILKDLS